MVDIHANYTPDDVWPDNSDVDKDKVREWSEEVDAAIELLFALGGGIYNGYLQATVSSNVLTLALKTLAGADPSASDPIYAVFRSATVTSGLPDVIKITSALSLAVPAGALLGTSNGVPFCAWATLFNDAGTPRLGIFRGSSVASGIVTYYPLNNGNVVSSTAIDDTADSAGVHYTGTAVSSKPMQILARMDWNSGLTTAGMWSSAPSTLHPWQPGMIMPGGIVSQVSQRTGAVGTGSTVIPKDDTIPQSNEGDQYLTQAVSVARQANILEVFSLLNFGCSAAVAIIAALFQDSGANALAVGALRLDTTNTVAQIKLSYAAIAALTSTTFKVRAGPESSGTLTFNGASSGRYFAGTYSSELTIVERQG